MIFHRYSRGTRQEGIDPGSVVALRLDVRLLLMCATQSQKITDTRVHRDCCVFRGKTCRL